MTRLDAQAEAVRAAEVKRLTARIAKAGRRILRAPNAPEERIRFRLSDRLRKVELGCAKAEQS